MTRAWFLPVLLCACSSAAQPQVQAPAYDSAFWAQWGDGQAELDGYTLVRPRYGQARTGSVVAVFVTEPFSRSDNVKAEKPRAPSDVMQVLKLNLMEKFQTGVYDYQIMTSVFVGLEPAPGRPAGTTTKIASSTQEWCGTTYHEVSFDARGGVEVLRSYFDGESRTAPLPGMPGLTEDSAWLWARGLTAPVVAAGASSRVDVLASLANARLGHERVAVRPATLSRAKDTTRVTVPAGTFEVREAALAVEGGATTRFWVEVPAPHRLVRVERSDGLVAELTGTLRTPYWQKNREGDEALLQQLGLVAPRARPLSP